MKIQKKIQAYSDMFESKKRENGASYVVLLDNAKKALKESVYQAHGDRFPDDWVYGTYADLMQKLTEYEINSIDDVEEYRSEIVDNYVDVYTSGLTKWLASDIRNVSYIDEALAMGGDYEGAQLLSMAQYMAIDEIYGYIVRLLS